MKKHFDNLNGIRFILAFTVLILHTAVYKEHIGMSNHLSEIPAIYVAGEIAVSLFFTLSGFLITYYLLIEKQLTHTIQLKVFYIKRLLRIWPLYFFAILLYWFILPSLNSGSVLHNLQAHTIHNTVIYDTTISYTTAFIEYLFFMPQVANMFSQLSGSVLFPAPHLWSIGVEELFYLFIPYFLLKILHVKRSLLAITAFYFILPAFLFMLLKIFNYKFIVILLLFISVNSFCCMLLGSLTAYFYINHKERLIRFCNKYITVLALVLFITLIAKGFFFYWFVHEIYSFLFCILLVFLIEHKTVLLENKVFSYLGRISYGIYIYHNMAIAIILYRLKLYNISGNSIPSKIAITVSVALLTIIISSVSYELFEKKFIQLKPKSIVNQ